MSHLSDWSDTIARISANDEREMVEYLERAKAQMPEEIAKLPEHSPEHLIELFSQFTGGRMDPRENELRETFRDHIKAEIIRRMESGL